MTAGLLDAKQVADILGINKRAVYRLITGRKLASVKWGRTVKVAPDDLAKFIDSHKVKAIDLEALADTICA